MLCRFATRKQHFKDIPTSLTIVTFRVCTLHKTRICHRWIVALVLCPHLYELKGSDHRIDRTEFCPSYCFTPPPSSRPDNPRMGPFLITYHDPFLAYKRCRIALSLFSYIGRIEQGSMDRSPSANIEFRAETYVLLFLRAVRM